jgi:hypothetical protein
MANQMLSSVERVPTEITYLAVQCLLQSGILSLRAIIIHSLCHHRAREQGRLWSEWQVASGRNGNEREVLFRPVSTSAILGLAPGGRGALLRWACPVLYHTTSLDEHATLLVWLLIPRNGLENGTPRGTTWLLQARLQIQLISRTSKQGY